MRKSIILIIVFAVAVILLSSYLYYTVNKKVSSETLKGVSLSPRSFQQSDLMDFFEKAKQGGKIVSWAGDWNELGAVNGGPKVVTELASTYDYIPLIELQFFTQSDGRLLRPLNEMTKEDYKNSTVEFAEKYKPKYLAIGIEVNVLYEKSLEDFEEFVEFYDEVYDAVKSKSPDTKVFTVFQLEKMKGLNGGLFGGENDPAKSQWFLFDSFPKSDIIAFTTYPGLVYENPSEIPENYYSEIILHTEKPVAFTEVGWHSNASPEGWESSDAEQAEFVTLFFSLTKNMNKEIEVWSFLYDQNVSEPFNSMGLWRIDGTSKPAWDSWVKTQ
ncbi:MAG: hypothetical protein QW797_04590 [Thermoproteota archaeon]